MSRHDTGLRAEINGLASMLKAYAVQQTVGPLRGIGRFLLFGLIGSVCMAVSILLGALAVMRLLQSETGLFDANWSFVPYLAAVVVLVVALVLLIRAIQPKPAPSADPADASSKDAAQ